jgi:predicted Zn-dependent protease
MLGDMLIELNQPGQALREFETSLRDSPNRFNGLYGAARAAELSGDLKTASRYYGKVVAICNHADGMRVELQRAKQFLVKNP